MQASADNDNLRFPVWALCLESELNLEGELFVIGDVDGVECLMMYRNEELAELVVEQANSQYADKKHKLLTYDNRQDFTEQLQVIPHKYRHICWNKPLGASGTFQLQVIDCLLGWLIRHHE